MEQNAAPWRVFDAPAATPDDGRNASDPVGPSPGTSRVGVVEMPRLRVRLIVGGIGGAFAIGVVAVAVALSGPGSAIVEGPSFGGADRAGSALLAAVDEVVVDLSGAVVRPGVYHLAIGARIGDAIDAAGGFSPRVDAALVAATLNLAALLVDGSQIHVPARDESSDTAGAAPGGSGAKGGGRLVDLNTASQAELEALPGIGPVTATKIIQSRSTTPFRSINELRERKLVGEKTFGQLQTLVTVN